MNTRSDLARREALCELLSRSDSFDVLRRHRLVLEGYPDRFAAVPKLASMYIQTKLLERRIEDGRAA